jgi:hypothetical protein
MEYIKTIIETPDMFSAINAKPRKFNIYKLNTDEMIKYYFKNSKFNVEFSHESEDNFIFNFYDKKNKDRKYNNAKIKKHLLKSCQFISKEV